MGFLSGLGSALGAVGSAVGAVSGIFGMKQQAKNDAWQKNAYENSLTDRIKQAEANNFSRYAALQGSAPQIPNFSGSGLSLSDTAESLSNFSRIAENAADAPTREKVQSLEIRSMELDNRSKELENAKLEKELKSVSSPYANISPYGGLQGVNTALMEGSGSGNVITTSEKFRGEDDYNITRSLENSGKFARLVPLINGNVSIFPAEQVADFMSDDAQSKLAWNLDLARRGDFYASVIGKRLGVKYYDFSFANGQPQFFFSNSKEKYDEWKAEYKSGSIPELFRSLYNKAEDYAKERRKSYERKSPPVKNILEGQNLKRWSPFR